MLMILMPSWNQRKRGQHPALRRCPDQELPDRATAWLEAGQNRLPEEVKRLDITRAPVHELAVQALLSACAPLTLIWKLMVSRMGKELAPDPQGKRRTLVVP